MPVKKKTKLPTSAGSAVPSPAAAERPLKLIGLHAVSAKLNRSRWWVRDQINAGAFPKPVPLGGKKLNFLEHEIDDFIAEFARQRDNSSAAA